MRENVPSHVYASPAFCTKAKNAKRCMCVGGYLRDTMVHDIEESGRNIKFDRSKGCLSKKLTSLGEKLGLMTVNLTLALISYFDKVVQPSYMYLLSVQIIPLATP